ncbi:hypothetical protein [Gorillibacterium timonense]|uniref:hypothetical protein n=1 Tax=Gorillibacterium timonense TaxID=1689269 RepID=UPI00071CACC1|nr:hypothetical protein [Gorillibacterium timonense]
MSTHKLWFLHLFSISFAPVHLYTMRADNALASRLDVHWGFSWEGLVVFLLVMVPNLFYFWLPQADADLVKAEHNGSYRLWTLIEHASQAVMVALLVFLTSRSSSSFLSPYTLGMAVFLLSYYGMWGFYFRGRRNRLLLLGMAVFPVVYFVLAQLWLHNVPALVPTGIFGIAHVWITICDDQQTSK